MIEILADGVVKALGRRRVLDGVDLAVPQGELHGLVGPDGAGKTTLLRCLAGLYRVDAGTVRPGIDGQRRLGFAPQGFHLYGELTVDENIEFFGRLFGLDGSRLRGRRDDVLGFASMQDRGATRAGALSGGMKQKLTLACSLLHEPDILLLDEPTTGVDPLSRREFWDLIEHLHAQGSTILLASAYLDEVERCEHVVYLERGRVVAAGSPDELRGDHETLEDALLEVTS